MTHDEQATTAALNAPPGTVELVTCWADQARHVDLAAGQTLLIGRADSCDVPVRDAAVSRAHARLEIGSDGVVLEDLGSANGSRVNGAPVSGRVPVSLGALIEIGMARLVIRARPAGLPSPMLELSRTVDRAAQSSVSLVIAGETGVGKEVLTEEIHRRSGRSGPLVRINCAGLAATLLDSELFGHEKGAFTGAVQAKPGLIESAHGGTLFLDEVGEMPEATQQKLLRVLEAHEVRRVGGLHARPIDVRFIAATHRDLRTMAIMGQFREDLLFRINGLTLRVPALRERRDEIGALSVEFLRDACERAGRAVPVLSTGARVLLESYRWPGNIRELKNVIGRVALLCDEPVVQVSHLIFDPAFVDQPRPAARQPTEPQAAEPEDERQRIMGELARVGGNQVAAARALGMSARVLASRMDKLGIPRPRRK